MAPLIQRWHARLRRAGRWLAPFVALLAVSPNRAASPEPSSEYQLKAVFLFNFAQFVEWPAGTFANESEPFVIGIVGEDPFRSYLDDLVRGERIGTHPLQVRRFAPDDPVYRCQILYVSNSTAGRLNAYLGALKFRPVLTVSDIDSFARLGGMVRFAVEDGRIHLRVNLAAARAAHLAISSKILRVSTIVATGKD
jgi:hypothetical protein